MRPEARVAAIEAVLTETFAPAEVEVVDESHRHKGHPGARDGRGHFRVRVVTDSFAGLGSLARHRAIYAAMGELMTTDVHALSIEAMTFEETGD
jgi:BolA protein